jgi:aspartyl-tRNA(Asn)/glutamyl-tRNA(Gln) amidotransferase subunit A
MVIAVKDNIAVGGVLMTAGSRLYEGVVPTRSATAVALLVQAGAIVIGKTNMHELAMGSTSDNPFFGPSRNPWNPARSPGGSSGGSAAAVAADLCVAALGTDTGGSIRNPAAICGVTGLRPTAGLISNRGVVPVAPSFDTVGAMARSATDVLALHHAMGGIPPVSTRRQANLTVGVARSDYYDEQLSGAVTDAVAEARRRLDELGMRTVDVPLEDARATEAEFFELLKAQAAASHRTALHQEPDRFSEPLRRTLLPSERSPKHIARMLASAEAWRIRLKDEVFSRCDVLLTPLQLDRQLEFGDPALPTTASRAMRFTFPWSLAQLPAISIPCGAFPDGMPIGCQLVGPQLSDGLLLQIAIRFQEITDWHMRRPTLGAA